MKIRRKHHTRARRLAPQNCTKAWLWRESSLHAHWPRSGADLTPVGGSAQLHAGVTLKQVFKRLCDASNWFRRWNVVDSFGRSTDRQRATQTPSWVWSSVMSFYLRFDLFCPSIREDETKAFWFPFADFAILLIYSKHILGVYLNHLGPSSFAIHWQGDPVFNKQHAAIVLNISKWYEYDLQTYFCVRGYNFV